MMVKELPSLEGQGYAQGFYKYTGQESFLVEK